MLLAELETLLDTDILKPHLMKTSPGNADVQGSDEQFSDDEHSFFQSFIKHLLSTEVWQGGCRRESDRASALKELRGM